MKIALLEFCLENALPVCPTVNKECSRVQKITEGPTNDHRRTGGGLSTFTSHCADTWQETSGHEVKIRGSRPGRRLEGPSRHHVTVPSAGRHILRSENRRRLFRKQHEGVTTNGGRGGARNRRRQGQNTHRSCDDETRLTPLKMTRSPPPASGQQRKSSKGCPSSRSLPTKYTTSGWQIPTRLVSPTPAPRPRWRSSFWTKRYRPPSAVFSPATSSPGRNRTTADSTRSGNFPELPSGVEQTSAEPGVEQEVHHHRPRDISAANHGNAEAVVQINLPNDKKKERDKKLSLRPDDIFYIEHHPHQLLLTSCVIVTLKNVFPQPASLLSM